MACSKCGKKSTAVKTGSRTSIPTVGSNGTIVVNGVKYAPKVK